VSTWIGTAQLHWSTTCAPHPRARSFSPATKRMSLRRHDVRAAAAQATCNALCGAERAWWARPSQDHNPFDWRVTNDACGFVETPTDPLRFRPGRTRDGQLF
jgi:hypothetical protein